MGEDTIQTGVDKLLALFKGNERISIKAAAKKLNLPEETIQAWVDFLVEEKILGIEYNFYKPYIYLNKALDIKPKVIQQEEVKLQDFKDDFFRRAKARKLPEEKIQQFWKEHLQRELNNQKDYFITEAQKKGLKDPERLWEHYKRKVMAT